MARFTSVVFVLLCAVLLFGVTCVATAQTTSHEIVIEIDKDDAERIAKTLYGECRRESIPLHEKAAVVWCILNRVDSEDYPDEIDKVVIYSQFHGYDPDNPVTEELYALTVDVMIRWQLEKQGFVYVGRTLPSDYLFFSAYKDGNRFRSGYRTRDYWEWEYADPYGNDIKNILTLGE